MFGIDDALLLSAGTSIVGGLLGSKKKGGGTPASTEVVTMPQYSFTEPRLKLASDFISQNIQSMSEGKFPSWYQNASPYIKSSLQRPLDQTYFGRAGDRSTSSTNVALQASAALGTGPRSGTAQVNKALTRYEEASKAIDEFIQKTGVDVTSQSIGQMLTASNQMPKGPDAQLVQYGGQAAQPNTLGDTFAGIAGMIPQLMGSLNKKPGIESGYAGGSFSDMWSSGQQYDMGGDSWMPEASLYGQSTSPSMFSSFITPGTYTGSAAQGVSAFGNYVSSQGSQVMNTNPIAILSRLLGAASATPVGQNPFQYI